ncbi:MAG: ABC transporter permease, partial [Flavobacteriales bacterium]|nr:ABC transporter permease [Flavobacteriales bacterium]
PGDDQWFRASNNEVVPMPGRFRHRLGTGKRGEDVLSGLIHGTRVSLTIGLLSMGIAALLGILFGSLAGYFGDNRLATTRGRFITVCIGLLLAWYYGFSVRSFALADALSASNASILLSLMWSLLIFLGICLVSWWTGGYVARIPGAEKKIYIPVDAAISRMIEILISLPNLVLIITIAAIAKPSMVNLMIIIGVTSWTGIARLTRAEFLKIRNLEYIQAGQALGFSEARVIFRHALPNAIAPALVAVAFGIASAILVESALSFLGIGVPADIVTWGSLLFSGREHFAAWWLVVFPGIAIFVTVTVYNLLGEGFRDAIDPRHKQ